jgi:hypothetical protein
MASSYLEVGSKALTELQNDLTNLSKTLHELFELMNADMRQVGEAWRDGKYEEFVQGYRPQINKCEEISKRYAEWCRRVLEPAIEECIDIETTDVGGDGSGSAGGGVSSGVSDGAPASSGGGKFDGFNMGDGNQSKIEDFCVGKEKEEEMGRKKAIKPDDSGFDPRENQRPHYNVTPEQLAQILNGRSR